MKTVEKMDPNEILIPELDDLRNISLVMDLFSIALSQLLEVEAHIDNDLWAKVENIKNQSSFLQVHVPSISSSLRFAYEQREWRDKLQMQNNDYYFKTSIAGIIDEVQSFIGLWSNMGSPDEYYSSIKQVLDESEFQPKRLVFFFFQDEEELWKYKENFYETTGYYSDDEFRLLIMEEFDKERQKFERLRQKFDSDSTHKYSVNRPRIPENLRIEVWRRDGGKCTRCGSRENLEYDHIIPISKGGSNTVRNIELLCERCNRAKSVFTKIKRAQ